MKRLLIILLFALPVLPAAAQDDDDYRMEVGLAAGPTWYNGDLNHGFMGNLSMGGGLIARWHLNPRMAVKGLLTYDRIKGSTDNAAQFYPQDPDNGVVSNEGRHMNFSDGLVDLSFAFEYNFWPLGLHPGYEERSRLTPFIQLGAGATYAAAGKVLAPNVAFGLGAKYKLAARWNVGLDFSYHFTLSDRLDDLEAPQGIKSSGFKNKDHFGLALLYISYDIFPVCSNCNKD